MGCKAGETFVVFLHTSCGSLPAVTLTYPLKPTKNSRCCMCSVVSVVANVCNIQKEAATKNKAKGKQSFPRFVLQWRTEWLSTWCCQVKTPWTCLKYGFNQNNYHSSVKDYIFQQDNKSHEKSFKGVFTPCYWDENLLSFASTSLYSVIYRSNSQHSKLSSTWAPESHSGKM